MKPMIAGILFGVILTVVIVGLFFPEVMGLFLLGFMN